MNALTFLENGFKDIVMWNRVFLCELTELREGRGWAAGEQGVRTR